MKGFVKDPQATLDYDIDWGPWLEGDTLSTSVWVIDSPLVKVSDNNTTTVATIFVSGGGHGINYNMTNTITTAGGREDERSIEIRVRNR